MSLIDGELVPRPANVDILSIANHRPGTPTKRELKARTAPDQIKRTFVARAFTNRSGGRAARNAA